VTLVGVFAVLADRKVRWLGCLRGRALKAIDTHLDNGPTNCDAGGGRAQHKKQERHEHHSRRHDESRHVSLLETAGNQPATSVPGKSIANVTVWIASGGLLGHQPSE
jgi:hypothetical protein